MGELLIHPTTKQALADFTAKPSHGLLLTGQPGIGKSRLAKLLISQILGISPDQLESYRYLRVLSPEKGAITIDAIRELLGFFKLKTGSGASQRRFVIIDDADSMTTQAQNALLKILEEPPIDTLIILITAHPERLLPTIRSRTQLISVLAPPKATVIKHFIDLGFDETIIKRSWLLQDGSIAGIEQTLDGGNAPDDTLALVKKVLAADAFNRLILIDSLSKDRELARQFVATLLITADASANQSSLHGSSGLKRWFNILQAAHNAEVELATNGNPKLVLINLVLSLA